MAGKKNFKKNTNTTIKKIKEITKRSKKIRRLIST